MSQPPFQSPVDVADPADPGEGVVPEADTAPDPEGGVPADLDVKALDDNETTDQLVDEDDSDDASAISEGDEVAPGELDDLFDPFDPVDMNARMAGIVTPGPGTAARYGNTPALTLRISKIPGGVGFLQATVRVAAVKNSKGNWAVVYVLAQAVNKDRDTRFLLFRADGSYAGSWMIVKGGGHGASFHAYRSAAGNLYVMTWIKGVAHRIRWQGGKKVKTGLRIGFKGRRPVGSHEPYVGMRRGYKTYEVISLHTRFDLVAGKTKPLHEVKLRKRPGTQLQAWAVSKDRVYRVMGKTGFPAGKGKHLLDVFDWRGKLLYSMWIGAMHIKATSDEPQGITFTGTPGTTQVGKRSGGSKPRRSYPIWNITGLP